MAPILPHSLDSLSSRLNRAAEAVLHRPTRWAMEEFGKEAVPFTRVVVAKWREHSDYDDLLMSATASVWRALGSYEPAKGSAFSTYAHVHARGAALHYLRDQTPMIRVPAWKIERVFRLRREIVELEGVHGPLPIAYLARRFRVSEEDVLCASQGKPQNTMVPIDEDDALGSWGFAADFEGGRAERRDAVEPRLVQGADVFTAADVAAARAELVSRYARGFTADALAAQLGMSTEDVEDQIDQALTGFEDKRADERRRLLRNRLKKEALACKYTPLPVVGTPSKQSITMARRKAQAALQAASAA